MTTREFFFARRFVSRLAAGRPRMRSRVAAAATRWGWMAAVVAKGLLLATAAGAAEISGSVTLIFKGRPADRATADLRGVVLTYRPERRAPASPPAGEFEIVTEDKEFRPRVLVVPAGSEVRFPNRDPILHNVFSVSEGNRFDFGLYGRGEGKAVAFEAPGIARVYCNVHHSMVAYVVVLDTPHTARPEEDGSFRLAGLPPGAGTLTAWHERTEEWSGEVEVPAAAPLALRLEVTRPPVPPHLDKHGSVYRRDRDYQP